MDIGATVCTPKNPLCDKCPISRSCEAFINNAQLLFRRKKQKKAQSLKKT
jgi:A/G-specific adenine glycosylase